MHWNQEYQFSYPRQYFSEISVVSENHYVKYAIIQIYSDLHFPL